MPPGAPQSAAAAKLRRWDRRAAFLMWKRTSAREWIGPRASPEPTASRRSRVVVATAQAKKTRQESSVLQKDATSSAAKRRPPIGAPNAA